LHVSEFDRARTVFVIVCRAVNPRAYRIAAHESGVERFQQFGRGGCVPHSRIEPKIIVTWIKDDRHTVVNG